MTQISGKEFCTFGNWVIGAYLEFACLPVGREFDGWNFSDEARNPGGVILRTAGVDFSGQRYGPKSDSHC